MRKRIKPLKKLAPLVPFPQRATKSNPNSFVYLSNSIHRPNQNPNCFVSLTLAVSPKQNPNFGSSSSNEADPPPKEDEEAIEDSHPLHLDSSPFDSPSLLLLCPSPRSIKCEAIVSDEVPSTPKSRLAYVRILLHPSTNTG